MSNLEQLDLGKFAALAPQNRGVKVEIFTDFQAVEEWMLEARLRWESESRVRFHCDRLISPSMVATLIKNKLSDRSDSLIAGGVRHRVRWARGFGTAFAIYN